MQGSLCARERLPKRNARLAACARIVLAIALAMTLAPGIAYGAYAGVNTGSMDNPTTNAYNSDTENVGTVDNPYRILVGQGASCRPSAFWSNGENQASGGGAIIPDMVIVFENREGNTVDGTLLSSYTMNTAQRDPNYLNETWTYAFRFGPYVATDTSTGDLRFATASKGSFSLYFPTYQFKLNVAELTKSLDEKQQAHPGDTVSVTYYGGYDSSQTSRGTNYTIDFAKTDTNTEFDKSFVVDADGFITIDPLPTGGNYVVKKTVSNSDKSALREKVSEGRTLLSDTEVSSDGSDVASEKYWVSQAAYTTFDKAIKTAQSVIDDGLADQGSVNVAYNVFVEAYEAFSAERSPGKASSKSDPVVLVDESTGIKVSGDLPKGVSLKVGNGIEGDEKYVRLAASTFDRFTPVDHEILGEFTIDLVDEMGQPFEFSEPITLTFSFGPDNAGREGRLIHYWVDERGVGCYEYFDEGVSQTGEVSVQVSSLSPFRYVAAPVVQAADDGEKDVAGDDGKNGPKNSKGASLLAPTGDSPLTLAAGGLTLAAGAAALLLAAARKKLI